MKATTLVILANQDIINLERGKLNACLVIREATQTKAGARVVLCVPLGISPTQLVKHYVKSVQMEKLQINLALLLVALIVEGENTTLKVSYCYRKTSRKSFT